MKRDNSADESATLPLQDIPLSEVKLFLPDDLARAYQRCCWLLIHEGGKSRPEIMKEMIRDFLVKHGC